jgi:hypothetical protein
MFGLELLTLPVLLGGLTLLFTIAWRVWQAKFSRNARAEKIHAQNERDTMLLEVERKRLESESKKIDAAPPKTGQDLVDDFTDAWKGPREE